MLMTLILIYLSFFHGYSANFPQPRLGIMRKNHISVRDFLRLTDGYILTVDEGTTQCKCALWDPEGKMKYLSVREVGMIYGSHGEIEMNPFTILDTVRECIKER